MHYKYNAANTVRQLIDEDTGEILAEEALCPDYASGAKKIADAMKKAQPLFKTPYNHSTDEVSLATSTACPEITKAIQSQKDEADINTIVNRFLKTGELPQMKNPPQYADLIDIDFQEAMDQVNLAQRSFDALPAKVRNAFGNSPAAFLAYVDHCVEMGDLDPLKEFDLTQIKTEEPAFEERLAAAITKAYKPPSPPADSPAPKGGKEPPSGS